MLKKEKLFGISCKLIPIEARDTETIVKLRTGNNIYMENHPEDKTSIETHKKWFEKYTIKGNDIHWLVRSYASNEAIGQTALSDFDFVSKKVRTGPILFNDNARFFAFESELLKLEFAFEKLNLNKVYSYSRLASKEAVKFLEKMGFKHDGYLRNDWWSGTEFLDYHLFSMLKDEYYKNRENIYLPYLSKIKKLFGN